MSVEQVPVSVVVPVYNGGAYLQQLLRRIFEESNASPAQVIVVDGESEDQSVAVARQYPVDVLLNPARHAAAGRNLGWRRATTDAVAFTDADCVPEVDWVRRVHAAFAEGSHLVGVGGRMERLEPANRVEAFCGHVFLDEIMRFHADPMVVTAPTLQSAFITANCAYRRSVLQELGGFRDVFANHGEDIDLYWRVLERYPGRLRYDPRLTVSHRFPRSLTDMARKYFQYGIASSKLTRYHFDRMNIDFSLYRKLGKHLFRCITARGPDAVTDAMYVVQIVSHLSGKYYGSITSGAFNA